MSFNGIVGLKSKDDLKNEFYNFHVESLKGFEPLTERDLYPLACDGVEMFKHDLSICLIENIKIKGKRNIIKNHENEITKDVELIKDDLFNHYVGGLTNLYSEIDDNDWGVDGEWFNIINIRCKEKYGFYFTDYDVLKVQVNNAHMTSNNIDKMCYWLAKKVNVNKKFDTWQKVLEFSE